jgi:GT2 family glycosyltransferase
MRIGVSLAICTHNGALRLPETLACVARQTMPDGHKWEVVVVDNASTDGSAAVARSAWPSDHPVPMRVIHEKDLGKRQAVEAAFASAKYDIVSFVDDDNWIDPAWLATVANVMASRPDVAACGGRVEAIFETTPPSWFTRYQGWFAVGEQAPAAGDITEAHGVLWGAGLSVRKAAWEQLKAAGWRQLLVDRKGQRLSTGGDNELCHALRLAGWRIWYEPNLFLWHFIPSRRLQWNYLRSLMRANGEASLQLEAYEAGNVALTSTRLTMRERWFWKLQAAVRTLLRHRLDLVRVLTAPCEDWDEALAIELQLGRVLALLRFRDQLDGELLGVRHARWRSPTIGLGRAGYLKRKQRCTARPIDARPTSQPISSRRET